MPTYNKLVRDRIPELIEQAGKRCQTRALAPGELQPMLKAKLQEELKEYLEAVTDAGALEELADMLEVIHALAATHGSGVAALSELQQRKRERRGAFNRATLLIDADA